MRSRQADARDCFSHHSGGYTCLIYSSSQFGRMHVAGRGDWRNSIARALVGKSSRKGRTHLVDRWSTTCLRMEPNLLSLRLTRADRSSVEKEKTFKTNTGTRLYERPTLFTPVVPDLAQQPACVFKLLALPTFASACMLHIFMVAAYQCVSFPWSFILHV